ncbi:MAG: alanine racemase [Candidatus Izemoplasmatales bacterium]
MFDRVKVVVNLNHLWHNYTLLKSIHHDKRVMAVVKADAYGHGGVQVAQFLESKGCDFFAVTDLLEAIELREAGIKSDILIFGKTLPENIKKVSEYDLIQTVDSYDYAYQLNHQNLKIKIHIILDTGMSRFGIYHHRQEDLSSAKAEVIQILNLKNMINQGIYSHFACADEDNENFTNGQFNQFKSLVEAIENEGYSLGLKHVSNSASIIKYKDRTFDMVRTGIAMYGYPPIKTKLKFLPVMSVFARVIALRNLQAGDGVSYGQTYQINDHRRIASIAIGYADGYPRFFSNNDIFIFKGHSLPVVGRVCMGVTMVDVTGLSINIGDQVEVFGIHKSLESMAVKMDTITYELLTNMSKKRLLFEYIYE